MSVKRWTSAPLIGEAHAWLRETAGRCGRTVSGEIEQPHIRPWSTVFRAGTDRGAVYLKVCGPSQAHEPALTKILVRTAPELMPEVLGIHPREPWMLLADGGAKLRDVLSGTALLDAWADVLPRYAALQRALLDRERDLLATGTPDRRLETLAGQLRDVIGDERTLAPLGRDALASGVGELRALLPHLDAMCTELAALGVGATIQHDDLHDGNVLARDGRAVIFDWGDACVTHPFLSLWIVQRVAAYRAHIPESDPAVMRLRDAYLEPWTDVAPRAALTRAAELGARLGSVTRALCWYAVATMNEGVLEDEPDVVSGSLDNVRGAIGAQR